MENFYRTNLVLVRAALKKTQEEFAEGLGIKGTSVSAWERGVAKPSGSNLELMKLKYNVNPDFLEKNEGEMFLGPIQQVAEQGPLYSKNGGWQPQTTSEDWGLLGLALRVLNSNSIYSQALGANIRAFHSALVTEKKLADQDERLANQDRRLIDQENKINELLEKCDKMEKVIKDLEERATSPNPAQV